MSELIYMLLHCRFLHNDRHASFSAKIITAGFLPGRSMKTGDSLFCVLLNVFLSKQDNSFNCKFFMLSALPVFRYDPEKYSILELIR